MKKIYILILASVVCSTLTYSQTEPERIVKLFGDRMASYVASEDPAFRSDIIALTRKDNMKCIVDDGISRLFVDDEENGLQKGSIEIETYLNKMIDEKYKLTYSHEPPVWLKDYKEPTAFKDKTDAPLYIVKMDVGLKGSINFSGTCLFFVRNGIITKVIDEESPMSRAIELYSSGRYEEAFRIFRGLAYKDPSNYEAQYYTAVMEIKKQGCGFLDAKVRDMEAAWWVTRGVVANSLDRDWTKERMSKLFVRFSIDEKPLPYNTHGRDTYIRFLMTMKLVSEGRMPFKENNFYGYMNEQGKIVVPATYSFVYPFDECGLAMVIKDEKVGFINKGGDVVIPIEYDAGIYKFVDGKTFVLRGDKLVLVSKEGEELKQVGEGFDRLCSLYLDGKGQAHNKFSDYYYVYDMEGNAISVGGNVFSIDYKKLCYFQSSASGDRLVEEPIMW